jgi:hypothetical protein
VIEANPLKYSVMAARCLALGLLLLLCVTPVGWAAEPAGATVVLQLPASMSPDQVKGLIADLAAKGAEPAATPVDLPSADPPALMTSMKLTVRIWEETKKAMRACRRSGRHELTLTAQLSPPNSAPRHANAAAYFTVFCATIATVLNKAASRRRRGCGSRGRRWLRIAQQQQQGYGTERPTLSA